MNYNYKFEKYRGKFLDQSAASVAAVAGGTTPPIPIEGGDEPLPNEVELGLIKYELAILKLAKYEIEHISENLYKIISPDKIKFIVQFSTESKTVKPKILFEGHDIYDYLLDKKVSAGLDPTLHYQIIKLILEEIPYPDTRDEYIREIAKFEEKRNKIRELEEKKHDLEEQKSDIDIKFKQKIELFKELRLNMDLKNDIDWKTKYKTLFGNEFELTKLNESNFYWILLIPIEVDIGNIDTLKEYIISIKRKDARKYSEYSDKKRLFNAEKEKIEKEKEIIDQRIKENNELLDKLNKELSDDKDEQDKKDKLEKLEKKYEQFNRFIKRVNIFPIPIKELTTDNLKLLPNADLYELEDIYNKKIANILEQILLSKNIREFHERYTYIYLLYNNQFKIMSQIWYNIRNNKKSDEYKQIEARRKKINDIKNTTEEMLKKIDSCYLLYKDINTKYPEYIKSPINIKNISEFFEQIKNMNECYIPIIKLFNGFNDDRKEYGNLLDGIRKRSISIGCEKFIAIINKEIPDLSKLPEFQKLLKFIGKYEKSKILDQLDVITIEYLDEIIIELRKKEIELSEIEKKEYEKKISKQIQDLLKSLEFQELLKEIDNYKKNIRGEKYVSKMELLDIIKSKIYLSIYENNKQEIEKILQHLEEITKELSDSLEKDLSESKKIEFIKNNLDIIDICKELTKLYEAVKGIITSFYANLDNLSDEIVKSKDYYLQLEKKLKNLMRRTIGSDDSIDFFKILKIERSKTREEQEEQLQDQLGDFNDFWAHIKGMATEFKKLYNKDEKMILHLITYYDTLPPDIKKIYNKSIEKLRELRSMILVLFNI
jgi:hypothetical protein